MKFGFIILFLISLVNEQPDNSSKDVIVFRPIGDFTSVMKPMLISTKKLDMPLSGMDIYLLKLNKFDIKSLSKEKIDHITDLEYVKIVTNKLTFSKIGYFISHQSQYFLNGRIPIPINRQYGNSVLIAYNGLNDTVDYKYSRKFLLDLQHFLIINHCDLSAARKIAAFKYDSHPD